MRIRKYPQSHLVITNDSGNKLIIDPGYITFGKQFNLADFQAADAYLITHQHDDHLGAKTIKVLVQNSPVYGNPDVVAKLKEKEVNAIAVSNGQKFYAGGFEIVALDLPHCKMQDGSDGPPNTGFLINGVFFHPGDGIELADFMANSVALPIAGPSVNFGNAMQFARSLQAKIIIPIHYDYFKADPNEFAQIAGSEGIEVRVLGYGEETEI